MDALFKGRHFDREIITLCVRWYFRFKLRFRDFVEMMAERSISLAHTTIACGFRSNRAPFRFQIARGGGSCSILIF